MLAEKYIKKYTELARAQLAPGFDLNISEMRILSEISNNEHELIINAFLLGYGKGIRATWKGYTKKPDA